MIQSNSETAGVAAAQALVLLPNMTYDAEKAIELKTPDGAGAPELAEVKELRLENGNLIIKSWY
jgi:hypothetical protein